jgi:hypothetical protein
LNKSTDYHDYVFREGKLVGEFEEMYRNSATTPWHQDEQEHWIDVRLTKKILQDLGRFQQIHDFGCGTGDYLDLMAKHSLTTNGKSYGYDVSATACEKAVSFSVLDLTQRATNNEQRTTNNEQRTTNNEQRTTNNEQRTTRAAIHDSGLTVVCISKADHRHREYRQSNALHGSPSSCAKLSAPK